MAVMEDLYLDPYTVKDRQNIYTSLTDRYGVPVFTDEFRRNKAASDSQDEMQQQHLMQSVFQGLDTGESQEENEIISLLFIQKQDAVISQDFSSGLSSGILWYAVALIGAVALFTALLLRYRSKKIKEREDHVAHIKLTYQAGETSAGHSGQ